MYIVMSRDGWSLKEPDDCKRFHAEGESDEDYICVPSEWLREQAAGRVGHDWDERFLAMIEFAKSKGWVDDKNRVRAHVERSKS